MIDKEKEILIMEIVNRAEELGLMQTDRFTALLDMGKATEHFNLRLAEMLNANAFILRMISFKYKTKLTEQRANSAIGLYRDLQGGSNENKRNHYLRQLLLL